MFCTRCGAQNPDTSEFCTSCGQRLRSTVASKLKKREPVMVLIFWVITLGIYGLYWGVKTSWELNASGADIPSAWLIIIPIINIWWTWKFCEGVELVTDGRMSTPLAFILWFLLGFIGAAIVQGSLNKVAAA